MAGELQPLPVGGESIADLVVRNLDPVGILIGLSGVILLAYVVAIPANAIVIPTVLMLTVLAGGSPELGAGAGVIFELDTAQIGELLRANRWTTLTAVNLMLFSLLHSPCSTTIYTIYRETRSVRWTAVATLLPLGLGVVACFLEARATKKARRATTTGGDISTERKPGTFLLNVDNR